MPALTTKSDTPQDPPVGTCAARAAARRGRRVQRLCGPLSIASRWHTTAASFVMHGRCRPLMPARRSRAPWELPGRPMAATPAAARSTPPPTAMASASGVRGMSAAACARPCSRTSRTSAPARLVGDGRSATSSPVSGPMPRRPSSPPPTDARRSHRRGRRRAGARHDKTARTQTAMGDHAPFRATAVAAPSPRLVRCTPAPRRDAEARRSPDSDVGVEKQEISCRRGPRATRPAARRGDSGGCRARPPVRGPEAQIFVMTTRGRNGRSLELAKPGNLYLAGSSSTEGRPKASTECCLRRHRGWGGVRAGVRDPHHRRRPGAARPWPGPRAALALLAAADAAPGRCTRQ